MAAHPQSTTAIKLDACCCCLSYCCISGHPDLRLELQCSLVGADQIAAASSQVSRSVDLIYALPLLKSLLLEMPPAHERLVPNPSSKVSHWRYGVGWMDAAGKAC